MSSYASYLLQTILTLVLISGAAVAMVFAAKKAGMGKPSGPIDLVGSLPLDARRGFYLVRVGKKVVLVGASEAGFSKLGEFEGDEVPIVPGVPTRSFREILRAARGETPSSRIAAPEPAIAAEVSDMTTERDRA